MPAPTTPNCSARHGRRSVPSTDLCGFQQGTALARRIGRARSRRATGLASLLLLAIAFGTACTPTNPSESSSPSGPRTEVIVDRSVSEDDSVPQVPIDLGLNLPRLQGADSAAEAAFNDGIRRLIDGYVDDLRDQLIGDKLLDLTVGGRNAEQVPKDAKSRGGYWVTPVTTEVLVAEVYQEYASAMVSVVGVPVTTTTEDRTGYQSIVVSLRDGSIIKDVAQFADLSSAGVQELVQRNSLTGGSRFSHVSGWAPSAEGLVLGWDRFEYGTAEDASSHRAAPNAFTSLVPWTLARTSAQQANPYCPSAAKLPSGVDEIACAQASDVPATHKQINGDHAVRVTSRVYCEIGDGRAACTVTGDSQWTGAAQPAPEEEFALWNAHRAQVASSGEVTLGGWDYDDAWAWIDEDMRQYLPEGSTFHGLEAGEIAQSGDLACVGPGGDGATCWDYRTGHGFFISPRLYRTW